MPLCPVHRLTITLWCWPCFQNTDLPRSMLLSLTPFLSPKTLVPILILKLNTPCTKLYKVTCTMNQLLCTWLCVEIHTPITNPIRGIIREIQIFPVNTYHIWNDSLKFDLRSVFLDILLVKRWINHVITNHFRCAKYELKIQTLPDDDTVQVPKHVRVVMNV